MKNKKLDNLQYRSLICFVYIYCHLHINMKKEDFNQTLPALHRRILLHLTSPEPFEILHNYVKSSANGDMYNMVQFQNGEDIIDISIVYHEIFEMPVLYFKVNGSLDYPGPYGDFEIHPLLDVPYLMCHPCESELFLANIADKKTLYYLTGWFGIHLQLLFPDLQLRVPSLEDEDD